VPAGKASTENSQKDKDSIFKLIKQFVEVCYEYMLIAFLAPLVALIIVVVIYHSYLTNEAPKEFNFCEILKYLKFITDKPVILTHTIALLISLWAQISVATFYEKREHFNSIGLLIPVFSTCFVIASLAAVNSHAIQMRFNFVYLGMIVIWDGLYWRFTVCVNKDDPSTKSRFDRCVKNSKGALLTDSAVFLSYYFVYLILKLFKLSDDESHLFEAGAFGAILFFSAFLLVNDLREWNENEKEAIKIVSSTSTPVILVTEETEINPTVP
jgi:hypothetical protein